MFQIRLATPDDLQVILDLIEEAAAWLRTRDTDQWASPWPNEPERDTRVLRGLLACRTWIVEDYGIPVASVTYRPDGNAALWNKAELRESAGYMSRLVVSRKYAGTRTGAALTDWAGLRSKDEFGAQFLRIDVWTTNIRLHAYYEDRGFYFLRFCNEPDYPSAALFYKPTEDIGDEARHHFWMIPAIPSAKSREPLGQYYSPVHKLSSTAAAFESPTRPIDHHPSQHKMFRRPLATSHGYASAVRSRLRRSHPKRIRHAENAGHRDGRACRSEYRESPLILMRTAASATAAYLRLLSIGSLFR
ncbi:MAG: GNAT family N-acetyltransferase [Streptosporangiaceae bacterium]